MEGRYRHADRGRTPRLSGIAEEDIMPDDVAVECEQCETLQAEVNGLEAQLAETKRELETAEGKLATLREQAEAVAGVLAVMADENQDLWRSDLYKLESACVR